MQEQKGNCISDAETIEDFLGLGFLKNSQCVEMWPYLCAIFPSDSLFAESF